MRARSGYQTLWLTWVLLASPCRGESLAVEGAQGLQATLDAVSGRYEVRSRALGWAFAGTLAAPVSELSMHEGRDRLGPYRELQFRWQRPLALEGRIRAYTGQPIVLFSETTETAISDPSSLRFPRFTRFPRDLRAFSYQNRAFAPPSFTLEENATPWLLFDARAHAAVISPAANFMLTRMQGDGNAEISSGLNAGIASLPAGFKHQTLIAFGAQVNTAWETWGRGLLELEGARRPANDADAGLRYLGYWTDNGASYYYNYDRRRGYAGTLQALVERYRAESIPIRYLQLDSWWYYKALTDPSGQAGTPKNPDLPLGEWNRYGGLLRYAAHPAVFPDGLAAFQSRIGLPLIVHNRWIDPASPYHQRYHISGLAAIDPAWWQEIMGYIASAHVVTYEQDWMNVIYEHSPALATTPGTAQAFTDGMARAAERRGISLQYSMALPREFLQGARYANLTSARVSGDRFERSKWDAFLYTSRLASALGIWPWSDVFMSAETDNLLLATLSAGLVGIGDPIGAEDRANLLRAVRADGVIIKPDTPLVPVDAMYIQDAARSDEPMIACAHTDHGELRTSYVFSYPRTPQRLRASFTLAQVGVSRDAYIYDTRTGSARRFADGQPFTFRLAPGATAYFVVVPVARSGIALMGDRDKFVPDGRKRIATLSDEPGRLTARVRFAAQERSVHLFGYAARAPVVTAVRGTAGRVVFDPMSGRFDVEVFPDPEELAASPGGDPEREAIVSLHGE
ncbi:MAG: hypothetical protein WA747_02305 [Steroidobacteraceae bacterium]